MRNKATEFAGILLFSVLFLSAVLTAAIAYAADPVTLRIGEHDSFSRLVFDFETMPTYEAIIRGEMLDVHFPVAHDINLSVLEQDPLQRITDPVMTGDDRGLRLLFRVPSDATLRHFMSGQSLVLDVITQSSLQVTQAAQVAPEQPDETVSPETKTVAAPALEQVTPGQPETKAIPVSLKWAGNSQELAFGWWQETAAAAFVRGTWLWVVFDHQGTFDLEVIRRAIRAGQSGEILAVEAVDEADYSLLRFHLRGTPGIGMTRSGPVWHVRLSQNDVIPRTGLVLERQENQQGPTIFVADRSVGARIHLTDPEVGDRLVIIPLASSSRGLAESRQFVNMELLQSAQGLVVRPLSDDIEIVRFAEGVRLGAPGGLALSGPQLGKRFLHSPGRISQRILDIEAWGHGNGGSYSDQEQEMLVALSLAGPAERKAIRWDLARFYIGHGAAAESLAMLTLLSDTDPDIVETPEWRAVHGLALLHLNRPADALVSLMAPELDAESDIWLWRALAARNSGRMSDALTWYNRGREATVLHGRPFLTRLHIAMAEAAFALGSLDLAADHVGILQNMGLDGTEALMSEYLAGRLAESRGDFATARARYQDAASSFDRALSARARFASVRMESREGALSAKEAVEQLERLRFAWRGDELELDILETLAGYYEEGRDYRKALEALQFAAMAFPDTARSRAIAAHMSQIFATLFLNGGALAFSPLEALALFYDFNELTPLGADGDRMIRNLVDRLVSVDLLDRAAILLEHQVSFRLEGAAQASVASKLGKIYLLDGEPEKALQILRATRQTVLPDDVTKDRILVTARALTELKRYEEAIVSLDDIHDPEADRLRADIYWANTDWPALTQITKKMLGDRYRTGETLGLKERETLIRHTLALSFLDDRSSLALIRARYQPLIRTGDYAGIFDLLTSPEGAPEGELSRIVGSLGGVDRFQSFLSAYRAEFMPEDMPAVTSDAF